MKASIPVEFVENQIEYYEGLFEKGLYGYDDYDVHYRMMADSLRTLIKKWEKHCDNKQD